MKNLKFTTIAQAKRDTGLAYLGNVNTSSKLLKNGKVSNQLTYGLYLAPASISGYNVCSHSTPECRLGCLATSGRAAIEIFTGYTEIQNCRAKKSKLFNENTSFFMQWLIAEIKMHQARAAKTDYGFSVRLNCTSDINWANVIVNGQNIFQIFSDVSFYDYTKNHNKFTDKPENYHLTYSYTGRNWNKALELLNLGFNIAMVFNVKKETELPQTFNGYNVVNGDLSDYRINDAKGIIVGLKWKRIANRDVEKQILNSVFVVQPNDVRCNTNVHELELVA
jgi:hypothetical protein